MPQECVVLVLGTSVLYLVTHGVDEIGVGEHVLSDIERVVPTPGIRCDVAGRA